MIRYCDLGRPLAGGDHAAIDAVEVVHVATQNGDHVERPLSDPAPFDRFGVVAVLRDGLRVLCKTSHGYDNAYDMATRARRVVEANRMARLSWIVNAINASRGW